MLWDSVVHYTSLGRRKSIDHGNSFDVHGTTVTVNFRAATNSFLHKGEGEIRYQHFDQPGGQSTVSAEIRTAQCVQAASKPMLFITDEKKKEYNRGGNCMEGRR